MIGLQVVLVYWVAPARLPVTSCHVCLTPNDDNATDTPMAFYFIVTLCVVVALATGVCGGGYGT
jgi:hypothetical protein